MCPSRAARRPVPDTHQPKPVRRLALETLEPTSFGYGFISGLISAILGIAAFGIVVALRFPGSGMHPPDRSRR